MKPMYNDHDADDMKRMPKKGKKPMGSRMSKMARRKKKPGESPEMNAPYPQRTGSVA